MSSHDERAGAEIVHGEEECRRRSLELLSSLGFPRGLLPLKDLVECGMVRETGFVWMKQKRPSEHLFESTGIPARYSTEVTAYVEERRMKNLTGVKSKHMLMWVPVVEMSIEDPATESIYFKTPMGIGKSFPIAAFLTEEEKQMKLAT